eukprot:gene4026-6258_t
MKIDEPPTPYNDYHMDKDHELSKDLSDEDKNQAGFDSAHATESELHARLVMAGSALEGGGDPAVAQDEEGASTPEAKAAKEHEEEFKKKRKAVYADEGAKFKELLKNGVPLSDEDEA